MLPRSLIGWLALGAAVVSFSRLAAVIVVRFWWYQSMGHADVVTTLLGTTTLGFVVGAAVLGGATHFSARHALATTRNRPLRLGDDLEGTPVDRWLRQPGRLGLVLRAAAVVAAMLGGLWVAGERMTWLSAWGHVPFGEVDPIFGVDLGTLIFVLPAVEQLRSVALIATLMALGSATIVYLVRGAFVVVVGTDENGDTVNQLRLDGAPRRHLALLAAIAALLVAGGKHLERYAVLTKHGPLLQGPSWVDVNVELPLLTAAAVAWALAAFCAFQAIDRLRSSWAMVGLLLISGVSAVDWLAPGMAQDFIVRPNELAREGAYISAHLAGTRHAWGIDAVEERTLSGSATLTWDDLQRNRSTIDGIRLWDHDRLLDTFRQVQEIRAYYEFAHVDNDRYTVEGQLRQTMLSPREFRDDDLPEEGRTWVNQRLVYTHGYGVALGPVNAVTSEGLPELWVKDLPPAVAYPDPLKIDQPAIYFGETMWNPVVVGTHVPEFDFPTTSGNATTRYAGKDGVVIGGLLRKLTIALALGDSSLLLSSDIDSASRVLLHRQISERVRRLAPFLWTDDDPTLVVADGRLVWIVEGYTTTSRYPYSAMRALPDGTPANYLRNSVKALVDAYDGTVTLYRTDVPDPIVDAWAKVFPRLLQPIAAMPASLRAHLHYPIAQFTLQTDLFASYHMTESRAFYNREDQWAVPKVPSDRPLRRGETTAVDAMHPYYTVMRLPGEARDEFTLMLPFTPPEKDNLSAWMVARSDGDAYGTMRVYRFPKDRLVYGPAQVIARIRQDDAISEKITLWNQQTSSSPLGTMLVIPIEESLLYIQPLYLKAEHGAIPELKRVIVGYEDKITMATTLDEGLRVVLGGPALSTTAAAPNADGSPAVDGAEALPADARAHWKAATQAAGEGRWEDFGREMQALGEALGAASDAPVPDAPTPAPEAPVPAPAP